MVKHPDNFSWDDLRVLLHVGRAARFNAAGRRLKMDQTTIARRIGNLERALNLHLTERSNAGVVLTADGERLMRIAERMETLAERVIDQGSSGKPWNSCPCRSHTASRSGMSMSRSACSVRKVAASCREN